MSFFTREKDADKALRLVKFFHSDSFKDIRERDEKIRARKEFFSMGVTAIEPTIWALENLGGGAIRQVYQAFLLSIGEPAIRPLAELLIGSTSQINRSIAANILRTTFLSLYR